MNIVTRFWHIKNTKDDSISRMPFGGPQMNFKLLHYTILLHQPYYMSAAPTYRTKPLIKIIFIRWWTYNPWESISSVCDYAVKFTSWQELELPKTWDTNSGSRIALGCWPFHTSENAARYMSTEIPTYIYTRKLWKRNDLHITPTLLGASNNTRNRFPTRSARTFNRLFWRRQGAADCGAAPHFFVDIRYRDRDLAELHCR